MGMGIQAWDANGVLVIDTSNYYMKTANIQIGEVTSAGSIDLSALVNAGATINPLVKNTGGTPPPAVTVNNGVLSWAPQSAQAPSNFQATIRVQLV